MYTPGNLIYFDPFYFKDGGKSKPKYFLVLKVIADSIVLASLPSSINHLPQSQQLQHGCLEIPEICITCYVFEKNKPITKCGWSFNLNTMLYGNWLDEYKLEFLKTNYPIKGVDYEVVGQLTDEEYNNVIDCFSKSAIVKRKYKGWLAK